MVSHLTLKLIRTALAFSSLLLIFFSPPSFSPFLPLYLLSSPSSLRLTCPPGIFRSQRFNFSRGLPGGNRAGEGNVWNCVCAPGCGRHVPRLDVRHATITSSGRFVCCRCAEREMIFVPCENRCTYGHHACVFIGLNTHLHLSARANVALYDVLHV